MPIPRRRIRPAGRGPSPRPGGGAHDPVGSTGTPAVLVVTRR